MLTYEELVREAQDFQPGVVDLRREIHRDPELGLSLPATKKKVLDALDGLPLEIVQHEKTSGLVATLRGAAPGPKVLLRGDMDALPMPEDTDLSFRSENPGAMHACGHDAHTAMLAGAAQLLSRHRESLRGEVVFMFQPGEEGFHGARYMIDEGAIEGCSAAFALHVAPQIPSGMIATRAGAILASADFFEMTIRGKGGHASMPHDCVDPIPVACEVVSALQSFVTRRIAATDPVVLSVTQFNSGTTNNVIPEVVDMAGTLRALSESARERAKAGLQDVVHSVAAAHGCEADIRIVDGYPVTENDPRAARMLLEVAGSLGERSALELPTPTMGAEDFSYVLNRIPGAMGFLGVRPPGEANPAPCHSNRMLLDEAGMAFGMAFHAAVAFRMLEGGLPS